MAINASTNFNINSNLPIDNRMQVSTIADRDSVPVGQRYVGMKIYVIETKSEYQLKDDLNTWDIIYNANGEYITSDKIASNAVSSGKIASNAVSSGKLASNAVTTAKIANEAVTKDKLSSELKGLLDSKGLNLNYIWWANQDAVSSVDNPLWKIGSINDFKTIGNAFTIMSASSITLNVIVPNLDVSTVTPSNVVGGYSLYNNGDLLVYAGEYSLLGLIGTEVWKRIPMHEAKSGLDGLMSGGDKDNLTYLYNRFIKGAIYNSSNGTYNGQYSNDCRDTGLYTNVDSGRPAGVDDTNTKETFSLLTIANPNDANKTPQLTLSQKRNAMWMRSNASGTWEKILMQTQYDELYKEMTSHVEANVMINWFNKPGFHFARLAEGNTANPIPNDSDRRYFIHVGKEKNGDTETGNSFQLAEHVATGRMFYRSGPVALGTSSTGGGSFGAYSWTELPKEKGILNIGTIFVTEDMAQNNFIAVEVTSNIHKILVQTTKSQTNILIPETFPIGWSCEIDLSKCTTNTVFFSNVDEFGSYVINDGNLDTNKNYLSIHEEDGWKLYNLGFNKNIFHITSDSIQINVISDTKEVIFDYAHVDNDLTIPQNLWVGWNCILDFTNVTTINHFDIGFNDGSMFGQDAPLSIRNMTSGKTYRLIKISDEISPSAFTVYEVDNINHLPITKTQDKILTIFEENVLTGAINLDNSVKEVICLSGSYTYINVPTDVHPGWQCIINNLTTRGYDGTYICFGETEINNDWHIDIGSMYSLTFMDMSGHNEYTNPNNWILTKIDPITRLPIDTELEALAEELHNTVTGGETI